MNAIVKPLWKGARGVDCNTKLTAATAVALKADGIDFVMRYVPLSGNVLGSDLNAAEVEIILAAGLGLGAVQHTRRAGLFTPNAKDGAADGRAFVDAARDAGLLPGMTGFYDMEGPSMSTTAADCAFYDHGWCDVVKPAGFVCGGYFGYGLPLTAETLWHLEVTLYWKSGSQVAEPARCGWALRQQLPFNQRLGGVAVDLDEVTGDLLGRFPFCLFSAPADVA